MNSISLRNYFAGLAMQALITKIPLHDKEGTLGIPTDNTVKVCDNVAELAYGYADSMIIQHLSNQPDKTPNNSNTRHG